MPRIAALGSGTTAKVDLKFPPPLFENAGATKLLEVTLTVLPKIAVAANELPDVIRTTTVTKYLNFMDSIIQVKVGKEGRYGIPCDESAL